MTFDELQNTVIATLVFMIIVTALAALMFFGFCAGFCDDPTVLGPHVDRYQVFSTDRFDEADQATLNVTVPVRLVK